MNEAFAIYPDGDNVPSAWFHDLEEATEWALSRYGGDQFSIRLFVFAELDRQLSARPAA
jgi:hypothetical protein